MAIIDFLSRKLHEQVNRYQFASLQGHILSYYSNKHLCTVFSYLLASSHKTPLYAAVQQPVQLLADYNDKVGSCRPNKSQLGSGAILACAQLEICKHKLSVIVADRVCVGVSY